MDSLASTSKAKVPTNKTPVAPIGTKSKSLAVPADINFDGIADPIDSNADDTAKPSFLSRVTDKVLIPVIALGLSTPIISHGICFVGSKILKHKMERETKAMLRGAGSGGVSNAIFGDPVGLFKEERDMQKAQIAAIKANFKRRKADAKAERKLLKAEKAAVRKSKDVFAQKFKKQSSPGVTTTALKPSTATDTKDQFITDTSDPPTYSEAIERPDKIALEWGKPSPGVLKPGIQNTFTNPSPGMEPAPTRCKAIWGWIRNKKAAARQGLKFDDKKAAFKSKLRVNKKAGLILGFGYWGNY
ncbi:hypothetical protein TWF718_003772 [Orbilia javanica]|uniref:Uncharacterized protein n=1 Tax=Orbilia javanica TaxID=47235 RepID=A0AAN8MRG6_9PEZI